MTSFYLLDILLFVSVCCEAREVRWFLGGSSSSSTAGRGGNLSAKTHLVHLTQYVTEVLPASCVQVATSLPPCRNMRQLLYPEPTSQILSTAAPSLYETSMYDGWRPLKSSLHFEEPREESPRGKASWRTPTPLPNRRPPPVTTTHEPPETWAEYFGFSERTVTRTIMHTATARVRDANVMVTFSITGCHPSRMPFDLPFCAPEPIEEPSTVTSPPLSEENTSAIPTPFHINAAEELFSQINSSDSIALPVSLINPKFAFQATPVLGVIHRSDSSPNNHLPNFDPR